MSKLRNQQQIGFEPMQGPAFYNSFLHDSTSELAVHAQQTLLNLRSWYLAHSSHGWHILFVKHNPDIILVGLYYVPVRIDSWNCR